MHCRLSAVSFFDGRRSEKLGCSRKIHYYYWADWIDRHCVFSNGKENLRKTLRLLWPFIWCTFLLCQKCAIKRTSTKIAISSFIKSETKQKRLPYVLAACCNLQIRQLSLSVNRPKLREIAANFYNGKLKSFKGAKFVCWLSKPTSSQKSLIKLRKVFRTLFS